MTWGELSPFAFAVGCIVLYGWGGYWKDRAQRLQHERDIYRRLSKARNPRMTRGVDTVLYDREES